MDQPFSAIAKEIQWLWPDSFSNNKYVIMVGWRGGGSSCWDGRESGWTVLCDQVQSQLLEQSCRIFCESILSCAGKTCPPGYSWSAAYSASECLPFLCAVWAWSCCQLQTVANTRWGLNNRSLNIGLLFLISSSVFFGLCVESIVVTTIREMSDKTYALAFCGPWELWDVKLSARSASSAVEHLLCGNQNREKGVATFVDLYQAQESCYERIRCTCKQACRERCKCSKAAFCAHPSAYATRQGLLTGKGQLR